MAAILTQVILEPKNHIPADRVTMSAAFQSPTKSAVDTAVEAFARWISFFNVSHGSAGIVSSKISSSIDRATGVSKLRAYELDEAAILGGLLGSPIAESTWTLGARASGAEDYPEECSVCVSFHALLTDVPEETAVGRPAARRRGRFYVGPLCSVTEIGTDGMNHVSAAFVGSLANSASFLAKPDPAVTGADTVMAVWSRADGVVRNVTAGFVDNEFDTQRRRGLKATARTLWTGAP